MKLKTYYNFNYATETVKTKFFLEKIFFESKNQIKLRGGK